MFRDAVVAVVFVVVEVGKALEIRDRHEDLEPLSHA